KQQLVGSERYTTNRLIELETAINNASEKIGELEKQLFTHVCKKVRSYAEIIQKIADAVSYLDVIQSFAWASTVHGYTQPEITDSGRMKVEKGRHPVVEAHLAGGSFVPNSLDLGGSEEKNERIALITGPNMAGKSTFLRQTALITLMAQAGSFIPAESGRLPVTSKIFCRVGASDNLARGESTFLVEMNETSFILRNADSRSLIIMDEVGRGTSTNDGLAIAWAVVEYLIQKSSARTLFATHYHELTAIENPAIQLLFLDAIEEDDNIIFLKTVKRGAVKNSYGIQVARLAGVPGEVIHRARDVLASLEQREHLLVSDPASRDGKQKPATSGSTGQSDLFSSEEMLINEISAFPVNESTPLEALNAIQRWKKLLS
ncbi:MAG: DNA mismatch repair protein MutS, partial [Spirochaetales bacterium]|nr:DNA mismatch repair protein MutS [Spirochaetales bacterium]MCF7938838.1 DNA mismatch repair protein MutS [Spirochaetales bacterium]